MIEKVNPMHPDKIPSLTVINVKNAINYDI